MKHTVLFWLRAAGGGRDPMIYSHRPEGWSDFQSPRGSFFGWIFLSANNHDTTDTTTIRLIIVLRKRIFELYNLIQISKCFRNQRQNIQVNMSKMQ